MTTKTIKTIKTIMTLGKWLAEHDFRLNSDDLEFLRDSMDDKGFAAACSDADWCLFIADGYVVENTVQGTRVSAKEYAVSTWPTHCEVREYNDGISSELLYGYVADYVEVVLVSDEADDYDEPSATYAENCDVDEDYRGYTVTIEFQGQTIEAKGWWLVGWLAPGANGDLDGSGLALWGDSQSGGWRVLDDDGQMSGLVYVREWTDGACSIYGADHTEVAAITCDEETRDKLAAAVKSCLVRPSEPDDEDMYDSLDDSDVPGIRWGFHLGAPVVATPDKYEMHPTTRDISRYVADATADLVDRIESDLSDDE